MNLQSVCHSLMIAWLPFLVLGQDAAGEKLSNHGLNVPPLASGVIPDTKGAITEILLHYDPDVEPELFSVYRDLLSTLPNEVRVTVICPSEPSVHALIGSWHLDLEDRHSTVVNVGLPISIWSRDRLVARQLFDLSPWHSSFVPISNPYYEEQKHNDLLALEMLGATSLMPPVLNSTVHIEGGNIVSNARHVFLGANVLRDNADIPAETLDRELRSIFAHEIIFVGTQDGEVPWCHVDMYLTPISDNTVLVASPRLSSLIQSRGGEAREEEEEVDYESRSCPSDLFQQQLDAIAVMLSRLDYRVLRIPAVIVKPEEVMVTYNNVLMDHRNDEKVVYMPTYRLPELDDVAAAIYRGLGFKINPIDVSDIFHKGGAIRCLVNVTERRPATMQSVLPARRMLRFMNLARSRHFNSLLERSSDRLVRRESRHRRSGIGLP